MWFPGPPPLPHFLCFLEIFTYLTTIFLKTEEIYIFIYCLIGHGHYFYIYLLHCLHIYLLDSRKLKLFTYLYWTFGHNSRVYLHPPFLAPVESAQ